MTTNPQSGAPRQSTNPTTINPNSSADAHIYFLSLYTPLIIDLLDVMKRHNVSPVDGTRVMFNLACLSFGTLALSVPDEFVAGYRSWALGAEGDCPKGNH